MTKPFIQRNPTLNETIILKLAISSYCDGSGMITQKDGSTIPGWRDFERVVAIVLNGIAPEGKGVFDVLIPSAQNDVFYGISVKSKEISRRTAIEDLEEDGRVHMEISNASATFWNALRDKGFTDIDFKAKKTPNIVGQTIVDLVNSWHESARTQHSGLPNGKSIDIDNSIHLVLSYSKPDLNGNRKYQWHSFDIDLPVNLDWYYKTEKCLVARDPNSLEETIIEWYALSGGQLKYYPKASEGNYKSEAFTLELINKPISLLEKTARYWPEEWLNAGGSLDKSANELAEELITLSKLINNPEAKQHLNEAAEKIMGNQ